MKSALTWQTSNDRVIGAESFGYLITGIFFFIFVTWAIFIPMEIAVQAGGQVEFEGRSKPIQHLEGGIISEILVRTGDLVTEGQGLLTLDATQYRAELEIISGRLWAKRALVERLEAERDSVFPLDFSETLKDITDTRAQTAMRNEGALFDSRRADRLAEIEVVEQRIAQLESSIEGTTAILQAKVVVSQSLADEADELATLLEDGYVDKIRIRELQRQRVQILGEIADLEAQISAANTKVYESRLQISQIKNNFKTRVIADLAVEHEALFDLEQRFRSTEDKVVRSIVRAPIKGFVNSMEVNTIGGVIRPGSELATIVPDSGKLIVRAKVSPLDIDSLSRGQEAEVRFSVFKDAFTVSGSLKSISADSIVDEASGLSYYDVRVELYEDDMKMLVGHKLVSGMPADVIIKTGTRTLLGYLVSPLKRAFAKSLIEE